MNLEKKLVEKVPLLGSSQNPEEVALSIKGFLIALVPLLLIILPKLGVNATPELVQELINAGFVVVGSGIGFYGVLRKFKK